MKDLATIARENEISERVRILEDEALSMAQVDQLFLSRAQKERITDDKALKLLNYLRSFESFKELESYWFWYYDPRNPKQWYKILDHVYRRSITENHLMN
jgi:aspartate carbamoyltransferase catalytic subunit